ncbi:MAG TPA: PQQ-dependent sugar dehydrogenase [Solirubrobacterales bacterium]
MACSQSAQAAPTLPGGFQEQVVFSGLTNPSNMVFSPDGTIFVAEKSGLIKSFDGFNDTTPTTVADLSDEVYNYWDRGLLGLAVDPGFTTGRPYLYALYTRDAELSGNPPKWGTPGVLSDPCPTPPGPLGDGCVASGRLSRLTISGGAMTAETPLITDWCIQYPSHSIGDLAFGSDGALYVSGGDGATWSFTDYGQKGDPLNPCGDPPGGVGAALTPPTAEGGSLRSQDVRTPGDPTGLDGTVLRVDPDTGAGLPGNPFYGSTDANARRIIAFGQRNPFRFTFRPGTNEVWIGEVGRGTWEEINRLPDPTDGTADNFGWPCYEGVPRQGGFDGANLDLCESLYSQGPGAVVSPYFTYHHDQPIVNETCKFGSSSTSGLAFYPKDPSAPFPASYGGALFFADYSRDCIWAMLPGADGLPDPTTIQPFVQGAANPVDLKIGPDGDLYYVDFTDGTIRRVFHTTGNSPPTAVATATPSNGSAPLQVQFDASGSTDPNGDSPLDYAWDLDGDGQFDDSLAVNPTKTYTAPGIYHPVVQVSDPSGATGTASVEVQVDNTPPVAHIDSPLASLTWAVGDTIDFSGSATDAQETLPASAFDWAIVLNHCPSGPSSCHPHEVQDFLGTKSDSFSAPDHDYPSSLTLTLTVTDSGGLTDTRSVTIDPKTVDLTLASVPSGLELALNDNPTSTPFTRTVIEGSENTLIAVEPQVLGGETYQFSSWSDGGLATHNITADQTKTLVATFRDVSPPAVPAITATGPASPANDGNPKVKGSTGAGLPTEVKLYTNASCSGSPAATGTPVQFAAAGITVPVPLNVTTQLTARATDGAGNDSACSISFPYTEDSTGPETVITDGPPSKVNLRSGKARSRLSKAKRKALSFSFDALEPAIGFECRFDGGAWASCRSPLRLPKLSKGAHMFAVRAKDGLGNVDQTPALRRFRIVKKAAVAGR